MRTSIFAVACSLTAVFACGGSRNVQKSDVQTKTEQSAKKDSAAQSKSETTNENSNIAIWDNETILEIYGDDLAYHKYEGTDDVRQAPIGTADGDEIHKPFYVQLEDGKVLVTGKVKRITHKSKGAAIDQSKTTTADTNSVKISSQNDSKTETDVKTKNTQSTSASIPWGWITILGGVLALIFIMARKAFF